MSESGPEAAAQRNHVGPSRMLDRYSMSESGPESYWATRTLGIALRHRESFRHGHRPDALPA